MNPSNIKKSVAVSRNKNQVKANSNLVTARTGLFYGLEYKRTLTDKVSTVSGLVATPNVIYYSNQTKVFFDFSDPKNTANTTDEFNKFWKNIPLNSTFTVTNGEVYNQKNEKLYDVSGTYVLTEIENNIVFANVTTTDNIDVDINLYSKLEFKKTPIFEFSSTPTSGDSISTFVINHFGENTKSSFTYMGAIIGDYLLIQNQSNSYEIEDIKIDSEGKEIIKVKGLLTEENRIGTKTLVQLLIKTLPNQEIPNIDLMDSNLGSCTLGSSCYENQTEIQCRLRTKGSTNATFRAGLGCSGNSVRFRPQEEISSSVSSNDEVVARLLNDISKNISSNPKSGRIF
jgi:hypothetical protein